MQIFFVVTFFFIIATMFNVEKTFAEVKFFTTQMVDNLKINKSNEDVLYLKKVLHDFGYLKNNQEKTDFTNTFDSQLQKAVLDFQKNNSLSPTGIIDVKTFKTINEFLKFVDDSEKKAEAIKKVSQAAVSTQTNGAKEQVSTAKKNSFGQTGIFEMLKSILENLFSAGGEKGNTESKGGDPGSMPVSSSGNPVTVAAASLGGGGSNLAAVLGGGNKVGESGPKIDGNQVKPQASIIIPPATSKPQVSQAESDNAFVDKLYKDPNGALAQDFYKRMKEAGYEASIPAIEKRLKDNNEKNRADVLDTVKLMKQKSAPDPTTEARNDTLTLAEVERQRQDLQKNIDNVDALNKKIENAPTGETNQGEIDLLAQRELAAKSLQESLDKYADTSKQAETAGVISPNLERDQAIKDLKSDPTLGDNKTFLENKDDYLLANGDYFDVTEMINTTKSIPQIVKDFLFPSPKNDMMAFDKSIAAKMQHPDVAKTLDVLGSEKDSSSSFLPGEAKIEQSFTKNADKEEGDLKELLGGKVVEIKRGKVCDYPMQSLIANCKNTDKFVVTIDPIDPKQKKYDIVLTMLDKNGKPNGQKIPKAGSWAIPNLDNFKDAEKMSFSDPKLIKLQLDNKGRIGEVSTDKKAIVIDPGEGDKEIKAGSPPVVFSTSEGE